jgi:predicted nucleic acid-binding protein
MGTKYLIDSNAAIEFLGGKLPPTASNWLQKMMEQELHHLSVINQIELLGFDASNEEMQILEDFVNSSIVLPLSDGVVQKTIELRKQFKIKLPDAIIAATALAYHLILITRNTADFKNISGLTCINAHEK